LRPQIKVLRALPAPAGTAALVHTGSAHSRRARFVFAMAIC
jgi:hypothetical protein